MQFVNEWLNIVNRQRLSVLILGNEKLAPKQYSGTVQRNRVVQKNMFVTFKFFICFEFIYSHISISPFHYMVDCV